MYVNFATCLFSFLRPWGMVGRGFGAWVDTWSSSPPLVSDVTVGYGGAWLARRGLANGYILKFKCRYALAYKPIRAGHIGSLACPTLGLKLPSKGPRPNPSPPGVVAWAFSANPRPNPAPYPSDILTTKYHYIRLKSKLSSLQGIISLLLTFLLKCWCACFVLLQVIF
ncbi:hypothetical protein Hanom_Chr12g01088561 [Helianthus anomalus]